MHVLCFESFKMGMNAPHCSYRLQCEVLHREEQREIWGKQLSRSREHCSPQEILMPDHVSEPLFIKEYNIACCG